MSSLCYNFYGEANIFNIIFQNQLVNFAKGSQLYCYSKVDCNSSAKTQFQCINVRSKSRRILLAVRAEAAKNLIVIFLCQHELSQTTLKHLPSAQKSLFKVSSRYEI